VKLFYEPKTTKNVIRFRKRFNEKIKDRFAERRKRIRLKQLNINAMQTLEIIHNKIHVIRDQKVMLDFD
jgi:hypothetical protein